MTTSFQTATTYTAGPDPRSVTTADVNGDGKRDLLVANANGGGGVAVLLGNGSGGFGTATTFAAGATESVTTADVNGDGKLDLVVADVNGSVAVLLGSGSGGFGTPTTYAAGRGSQGDRSVTMADVNGDGKLDIAVAEFGGVAVLLNNGSGGFGAATTYATGPNPDSITAGDVNGDGKPDLVVADPSGLFGGGANVAVLLGNGSGGFGAATTFAAGDAHSVMAADVNGDGKLDLVVAASSGGVAVLLGNGGGGFGTATTYAATGDALSVTTADVNGDGKLDLVVAAFSFVGQSGAVDVLLGNGSGGFGAATAYAAGVNPASVTTADVNGDGKPDIIVAGTGGVAVLLNSSIGEFPTPPPTPLTLAEISSRLYDLYDHATPVEGGFTQFASAGISGFLAEAFRKGDEIVVAFRGTDTGVDKTTTVKNILADSSFGDGILTPTFGDYVHQAAQFVAGLASTNPGTQITLTGHSLGGAIAALLGDVSGYRTITFDAPGPRVLEAALLQGNDLSPLGSSGGSGTVVNYRLFGDRVSQVGISIGPTVTIPNVPWWNPLNVAANHSIDTLINQLHAGVSPVSGIFDFPIPGAGIVAFVGAGGGQLFHVTFDAVTAGNQCLVDPPAAIQYQLIADPGSPQLISFGLPVLRGVFAYEVRTETGSVWSPTEIVMPGTVVSEATGFDGIQFSALDGAGQAFAIADATLFSIGFASAGAFSGTLSTVAGVAGNVFRWTAADGGFSDAANWADITDASFGPPAGLDEADFVTGGGTVSGTGTAHMLAFDGTASWTIAGTLAAGSDVIIGSSVARDTEVKIGAGGRIFSAGAAELATIATGSGALDVAGLGAAFTVGGQLSVGEFGIGQLRVENQAVVETGGGVPAELPDGFDVAQFFGSAGDATVAGDGSLLSNSGHFIVGDAGLGRLSIQDGGTVTTTPGTVTGLAGAVVANTTSASGSAVRVNGAGSNWQVTGSLIVGNAGAGDLAISAGGTVTAGSLDAGAAAGGSGLISVTGTDSLLNVAGLVTVGDLASATLSLLGGGALHALDLNIGMGSNLGVVTVADATSGFHIGNDVTIGHNGVLSVGAGVTVFITNNFVTDGALNLGGGAIIDPATVTNNVRTGGGGNASIIGTTKIVNNSTYYAGEDKNGAFILNTPSLTATGVLEIGSAINAGAEGNLVLNAGLVAATQTVVFTGPNAILTLGTVTGSGADAIAGFQAPINGFVAGDTIQVSTTGAVDFVLSGSVISLVNQVGGATEGTLAFANAALANLAATTRGALVDIAPCFAAGTRITAERGEIAVEDLREGDKVWTVLGERWAPVVWLGRRHVNCARHPEPALVWPVRVSAGAFGRGLPCRDLFLSPDHAVFVEGVLIPVKLLLNGRTIAQVPRKTVTYYHLELEQHDVVLSEGLPSESYLDTGDRAKFAGGQVTMLFPDFTARKWEMEGCAPMMLTGEKLEATRSWLVRRVNARVRRPPIPHFG